MRTVAAERPGDVRPHQLDRPGCGEPLAEGHVPADLDRGRGQGIAVAVGAGQMRTVAAERPGDVRLRQEDRPGGEPLAEGHVPADLHPGRGQGIAVAVGAGQLGTVAAERPGDVRLRQPHRPGRGESPGEEHSAAGLDPGRGQGIAVAVGAGQPRAVAVERPGDVRPHQLDRPGCGEPLAEGHVPADLHPGRGQGIAVAVGAGQLGTVAAERPGDVRAPPATPPRRR